MIQTVKIGQTSLSPKQDAEAAIVRMVFALRGQLADRGQLTEADEIAIHNVVYTFVENRANAVKEELAQG